MNTGHKHWTISDGWIPPLGDETFGFLNVSPEKAHVQIFIYYTNRDPVGPYRLIVPAKRMRQVRFNCLTDPEPIPRLNTPARSIPMFRSWFNIRDPRDMWILDGINLAEVGFCLDTGHAFLAGHIPDLVRKVVPDTCA